jgi:hypothetical protein
MDKVKEILGVLKKHHFWIFSVVVSMTILGCWYKAKGSLSQMYSTEKSAIESAKSGLDTIRSNPFQPNPDYKLGVETERDKLKLTTDKEWQRLSESQKSVFSWPKELPEFAKWEAEGRKTPMTPHMLQLYQNFIDEEFPRLEQLVNVRREKYPQGTTGQTTPGPMPSTGGYPGPRPAGGYGVPGAQTVEMIGIVDWDPADFMKLKSVDGLKTWGNKAPQQIEVLMCHESLAVYRSLLEAIALCNEGATDNDNAIVKQIQRLDIGKHATLPGPFDAMQNVIMPNEIADATAGLVPNPYANMAPPPAEGEVISKESIILEGRYVDGSGKPVDATAAQTAPPYAEFKLMKVRLALVVDQRGIPKLMANLANAKLGVEIHQVRVNPQETKVVQSVRENLVGAAGGSAYPGRPGGGYPGPSASAGPPGGSRSPYGGGGGSPYGGRREGGPPSGYGGAASTQAAGQNTNDATIEIKGIMYIYNPYDPTKTGSGTDASDARSLFGFGGAADGAAAAPAATPQ